MTRVMGLFMRNSAALLVLAVVLAFAPSAVAQSGASSTWATSTFVAVATPDDYLITVAGPDFKGCQPGEWSYAFYGDPYEFFGPIPGLTFWAVEGVPSAPPIDLHLVAPLSGALNLGWLGEMGIRVYRGKGVAQLFKDTKNRCEFLEKGPLVASGVARFNFTDADDSMTGPGAYQWGWTLKGVLDNIGVDGCGSTVQLTMLRRWVNKSTFDVSLTRLTASKGPILTCK